MTDNRQRSTDALRASVAQPETITRKASDPDAYGEVVAIFVPSCGCDPQGTHHCLDQPLASPGSETMLDRAMRDA